MIEKKIEIISLDKKKKLEYKGKRYHHINHIIIGNKIVPINDQVDGDRNTLIVSSNVRKLHRVKPSVKLIARILIRIPDNKIQRLGYDLLD